MCSKSPGALILLMLRLLLLLLLSLIVRPHRRLFMIKTSLLLLRLAFSVTTPAVESSADSIFVTSAFMVTSMTPLRLP